MSNNRVRSSILARLRAALVEAADGQVRLLRRDGWNDFCIEQEYTSIDPVTIAFEAFRYLLIDSDGRWQTKEYIIVGIFTFANRETQHSATGDELQRLLTVCQKQPVKKDDIRDWFAMVYGMRY